VRFPGQYFDGETGLHYNYFRYYDPSTGRYVTSDPVGLAAGYNTFRYVKNSPLKYFDNLGLFELRAIENKEGTLEYKFNFGKGCLASGAERQVSGKFKWIKRAIFGKKVTIGDRYSGINDVKGVINQCICETYDPKLKDWFVKQKYEPGMASWGTSFTEADAKKVLKGLREEFRRLIDEEEGCTEDNAEECEKVENLYPWENILENAKERYTPNVENYVNPRFNLNPDKRYQNAE
jgi:RHS repeat-associated protein